MRKFCLLMVLVAIGCGGGEGDFSSPEAAAESFMEAAADKDVEMLSLCFSKNCEGEFKALVKKEASQKMLDELAEAFDGASITGSETKDDKARVEVKFGNGRDETLKLVKEGDAWKIHGF